MCKVLTTALTQITNNKEEMKMEKITLVQVAEAIDALKLITPDGAIVGEDSVSGKEYFENFISIGTVYKTQKGEFRVIVDSIFYPKHKGDTGKVYEDAIRFIAYGFDPNTLELTGVRKNIGYKYLVDKCEIVNTSVMDYLDIITLQEKASKVVLSL